MKLGIGSYTYTWACGVPGHIPAKPLDAMGLLEKTAALGLDVVQFCETVPYPPEIWPRLRARADELGLDLEVGTRGILGQTLPQALAAATALRSGIVRVVIDAGCHEPTAKEAVDLLRPLIPRFADAGVALAIENHDRFPAATLRQMVEDLGQEWVGITLDTVNSFGALEGPEVVISTLAPLTRCLHLKDFVIRRAPSQMGFVIEGCAAGQGRLDIPALLSRIPPSANAIIELWTPFGPTLEETLAREAAWAEESARTMRRLIPPTSRER